MITQPTNPWQSQDRNQLFIILAIKQVEIQTLVLIQFSDHKCSYTAQS